MPYRKIPIIEGEVYHVFNRSVAGIPIFTSHGEFKRLNDLVQYYRYGKMPVSYSYYKKFSEEDKMIYMNQIQKMKYSIVEIYAYCIMPTHVHFLLRANIDNGISMFMRNIQHSYSKYFNKRYSRHGSVFQDMFKAVRIESDEQLLHTCRYIHLNPVTDCLTTIDTLYKYLWNSYRQYCDGVNRDTFLNTEYIMRHFKTIESFIEFTEDQADYQRTLANIKHLIF